MGLLGGPRSPSLKTTGTGRDSLDTRRVSYAEPDTAVPRSGRAHETDCPDPQEVAGFHMTCPEPRGNLDDVEYAAFRARVAQRLQTSAQSGALFTTDADCWTAYIEAFPAGEVRQHHNCTTCRHFLQRYGGFAVITDTGELRPALWEDADADPVHRLAVLAMARAVRRARVTDVFLTDEPSFALGTAITGQWAHLSALVPSCARHTRRDIDAHQAIAEKVQDHANVSRALGEYRLETLRQVVDLLKSDALYRAEKVLGPAQWLLELAEATAGLTTHPGDVRRANIIWRAVAKAPAGFCHPRSSMVGSLLDDLQSGVGFGEASRRFREKMDPTVYQRPQAAPKAGAVKAAEDLVAKLGIAPALKRRFAQLEDITDHLLWRPPVEPRAEHPAGVFAGVEVRDRNHRGRAPVLSGISDHTLTWARFSRLVLPDARSIEVQVPSRGNFVALVTAQDPAAPPILQWDRSEAADGRRNPVSWYVYNTGSPAHRWGLSAGAWATVDAACLMPWQWTAPNMRHHAPGAILIIRGARDVQHTGAALFPEILRAELHGARAVIEAYSARETLAGAEEATACGIMAVGATVRVTARSGAQVAYAIDRWD